MQAANKPQGHVGVHAALVKFVEYYDVEFVEFRVGLQQSQKEPLGKEADAGIGGDLAVVAGLVADELAELGAHLLRDALGHQPGRQTPGLQHGDTGVAFAVENLGDLGGLAGAGRRSEH